MGAPGGQGAQKFGRYRSIKITMVDPSGNVLLDELLEFPPSRIPPTGGKAPPPAPTPKTEPPSPGIGAAEKPPRVVLYRGTVYRFVEGRSPGIHDLGDGTYWSLDRELAIRYGQIRRLKEAEGVPGIMLRVEAEPSELGRVLDFYNNRALRAEWESFLRSHARRRCCAGRRTPRILSSTLPNVAADQGAR